MSTTAIYHRYLGSVIFAFQDALTITLHRKTLLDKVTGIKTGTLKTDPKISNSDFIQILISKT